MYMCTLHSTYYSTCSHVSCKMYVMYVVCVLHAHVRFVHIYTVPVQVCVPGTGVRTVQCTPGTRTTRTRTRTAVLLPGT